MSLARRLMASTSSSVKPAQAEYTVPGTYSLQVPAGVFSFSGVVIAAGNPGQNINPFPGGSGGNLHWNNDVPCTPGEWLTVIVGAGASGSTRDSAVKRGATNLLRAVSTPGSLFHPTLGGGGGSGGAAGPGSPGSGGLGGGGPGYAGDGGRGGDYHDNFNGLMPDANSGGGRGGDANGVPYGWQSEGGEGTGLLGLSTDLSASLGTVRCGAGNWAGANAGQNGGVRVLWGGGRAYPGNVPDAPGDVPAVFVSSANGSGSGPVAFTFHTSALEGDLVVVWIQISSSGSYGGVSGSTNWNQAGALYWKQVTAADITASAAGTVTFVSSGTMNWISATYRGPRVAVFRKSASDFPPASTVVIPGFTKRIDCQRVVSIVYDPDTGPATTPAGFTSRGTRTTPIGMRLSDAAPSSYTDGASVTYTGMGDTSGALAQLIELF